MKLRYLNDIIVISIIPHYVALYYTFNKDIYYSGIIILATSSSILWHHKHENDYYLYIVDHFLAICLSGYEILFYNNEYKQYIIYANLFIFLFHKVVNVLHDCDIVEYSIGHSLYHIASAFKTIFISSL